MLRKFGLLIFSMILIGIWACDISEPELPQWNVSLTRIPILGADTIILGEEMDDENLIKDADSLFHISFNGSEQIEVSDQMKQESITADPFSGQIGNFEINGNVGETVSFGVFEIFPNLGSGSQVIASTVITPVQRDISMSNFSSATFVSGTITVSISNNLPFDLGTPVSIELYDVTNSRTVTTLNFSSEITSSGSAQQNYSLAGETLSNSLRVILSGSENGTGGSAVNLQSYQDISVNVSMSNLTASSATAQIPNQQFQINDAVSINTDSMMVKSADISSGQLNLSFTSSFNFPVQLNITLPQITNSSGNPVTDIIYIPAQSFAQSWIDLSGTTLDLSGGDLSFDILADVLSDAWTHTTVSNTDKITTSVSTSTLYFSSVTAGVNLGADFPSFQEEVVDLDFEAPDINFEGITFTLVFTDIPADMDIGFRLVGTKEGVAPKIADYQFSIIGGITNEIVLDNTGVTVNGAASGSGSGIEDVINMLPEAIDFSGTALIDDDNVILTGTPVNIQYSIDVPFVFSMPAGSVLDGDISELDIEEDTRDRLRENFKQSAFEVTLANGLPFGGGLVVRTATAAMNATTPEAQWPELVSFEFAGAQTDEDGNVVQLSDQDVQVSLSEQQIIQLADSDYLYWEVVVDEVPKGRIRSTDVFILRAGYVTGTMRINSDLFDDEDESSQ